MKWPWSSAKAVPPQSPIEAESHVQQRERVFALLREVSPMLASVELGDETLLFSSGLLDSLAFTELVSRVESRFDLDLARAIEVTPQALDRLGDLLQAVATASRQR